MKTIVHFENHPSVASVFRVEQLEPRVSRNGLSAQTQFIFQDYLDRSAPGAPVLNPSDVAAQAARSWEALQPAPEKTAWIFDLDPFSAATPDSSYGLCVLLALAGQFGMGIEQFLQSDAFLTTVLTLYPDNLRNSGSIINLPRPSCNLTVLHSLWPRVKKILNETPSRLTPEERARALQASKEPGARIMLANSGNDNAWLAEVIVSWLA